MLNELIKELFNQITVEDLKAYLRIILRSGIVLFSAIVFYRIMKKIIRSVIINDKINPAQGKTVVSVLQSTLKYIISFVAGMMILVILGIDITPILTGAGILGFAIGFGSQNLVRDVLSGFFIIFEGQIQVGDFVEINGGKIRGTVEEIGLRVTKVREWSLKLNYVPNGEIKLVNNYTRGKMRPIIDVTIPYDHDVKKAQRILESVCGIVAETYKDNLVEKPEILGITDIQEKGVTFTLMAVTHPDSYWFIGRELRKVIVEEFSKSDMNLAYPHIVIIDNSLEKVQEKLINS